jgi:hypothetical protein
MPMVKVSGQKRLNLYHPYMPPTSHVCHPLTLHLAVPASSQALVGSLRRDFIRYCVDPLCQSAPT